MCPQPRELRLDAATLETAPLSGHLQASRVGRDEQRTLTAASRDQLFERVVAGAAAGAGSRDVTECLDGGRTGVDGFDDLTVGNRVADAGEHRCALLGSRPRSIRQA